MFLEKHVDEFFSPFCSSHTEETGKGEAMKIYVSLRKEE